MAELGDEVEIKAPGFRAGRGRVTAVVKRPNQGCYRILPVRVRMEYPLASAGVYFWFAEKELTIVNRRGR